MTNVYFLQLRDDNSIVSLEKLDINTLKNNTIKEYIQRNPYPFVLCGDTRIEDHDAHYLIVDTDTNARVLENDLEELTDCPKWYEIYDNHYFVKGIQNHKDFDESKEFTTQGKVLVKQTCIDDNYCVLALFEISHFYDNLMMIADYNKMKFTAT